MHTPIKIKRSVYQKRKQTRLQDITDGICLVNSHDKEKFRFAVIAQASKLITKTTSETEWRIISEMFGFSEEAEETTRLYRSQYFGDHDYPERVYGFLKSAYNSDSDRALAMVKYVIEDLLKSDLLEEKEINKYPSIRPLLEGDLSSEALTLIPKARQATYIEIKKLPGNFYYDLIDELNLCYAYDLTTAVSVLRRKLLENLMIDILRDKFGSSEIKLYFDTDHGRFHGFGVLIKNFSDRISDFQSLVPSLDRDFVDDLDLFREVGNSAAHTLEMDIRQESLEEEKEKFKHVVKTLVRLVQLVRGS